MFYSDAAGFTLERVRDDQKEITDSYWEEMVIGQSKGKVISTDEKGLPVLTDPPPLTRAQLTSIAEEKKLSLMAEASTMIAPLEDAQRYGMATETEASRLIEWQKYRVLLYRVNTEEAPDISWPVKPA